jgi:energy-coupling factor transporter ATP-binding protein EcfA2
MITKFWAKNFSILGDFSIDLTNLTLLVGPNASGKSTFLRGLRLLALLNRMPIYGQKGPIRLGFRSTLEDLYPDLGLENELCLGVECKSLRGSGTYEIALKYIRGSIRVVHEKAEWKPSVGPKFSFDSSTDPIEIDYRGTTLSSAVPRGASLAFLFYDEQKRRPDLEAKLAPLYELISCFTPFHVYRFSPHAIARPVEPGTAVAFDGMGLAAELDRLLGEERVVFDQIVASLTKIFPHIKQVNVVTLGAEKHSVLKGLMFETKKGIKVPAEMESDGVLLTLAYLWIATRNQVAIGIEEPETATYPSLLESRWEILQSMANGTNGLRPIQVLATTHSSFLLTAARDPGLVRVFEPQGNGTSNLYNPTEEFMHELIYKRLGWAVGAQ